MRFRILFLATVFTVNFLWAQDAKELLAGAASVYSTANGYSAELVTRTISMAPGMRSDSATDVPQFASSFRRLVFRFGKPTDYFLGIHSFTERSAGAQTTPGQPSLGGGWTYLSKFGNRTPKMGATTNGQFAVRDLPEEQFFLYFNSRISGRGSVDPILRYFLPINMGTSAMSGPPVDLLTLEEPKVVGRDEPGGAGVHIEGRLRTGGTAHVWIQEGTFLVLRSVVKSAFRSMPVGGPGFPMSGGFGGGVVETLYKNQKIDPKFMNADFTIPMSPPNETLTAEQMGFGPANETLRLAGMSIETQAPDMPPRPTVVETAPVAPSEPETQALTQEQMAAIVLIEGDGGSGTGFMTKIKDVDFVVTNLHVIGGNKKITIKTLRGDEIPAQGIFGAVGADIAIIRVAQGQGDLKLASDVFQSTKIGDKVVVVGNRRGGGVATQTSGAIKGVGPKLVEVDANFQPGNSGSPIVNLSTGEVVGIASYTESRRVEVENTQGQPAASSRREPATKVEKRWFGYRVDGVSKWEAIDLARFNEQSERIGKFRELSEALVAVINFELNKARAHPRLNGIISNLENRTNGVGNNQLVVANEFRDMFRVIRTIADDGVKDLTTGSYYDYFRTSQYWETSISAQLDYRKDIIEVLKRYETNAAGYVSRLRNGR